MLHFMRKLSLHKRRAQEKPLLPCISPLVRLQCAACNTAKQQQQASTDDSRA